MFDIGQTFFDAARAERCRLEFEDAVTKAGNEPDEKGGT